MWCHCTSSVAVWAYAVISLHENTRAKSLDWGTGAVHVEMPHINTSTSFKRDKVYVTPNRHQAVRKRFVLSFLFIRLLLTHAIIPVSQCHPRNFSKYPSIKKLSLNLPASNLIETATLEYDSITKFDSYIYNQGKNCWHTLSDFGRTSEPSPPMQCWSKSCCQKLCQILQCWLTGQRRIMMKVRTSASLLHNVMPHFPFQW